MTLAAVIEAWIELEDENAPWYGTEDYFDKYDMLFQLAKEALKRYKEGDGI